MASIERTAYSRLKKNLTGVELRDFYTPTLDEIFFAQETARTDESRLHLLVMLKTFQRLGYFPSIEDVPENFVRHLRSFLKYGFNILPIVGRRTLYKHHSQVRRRLRIKPFDKTARQIAVRKVYEVAATMDNPADLINVAVEELIKERYELPAFSTLDRVVRRVRTLVNRRIFQTIQLCLSPEQIRKLDSLLLPDRQAFRTGYNRLKTLPKKATLKHLQELLSHLDWLAQVGSFNDILKDVPPLKVKHFAGEAKALDAREIKDFADPKRYALLICLVHRAHVRVRDALGEMLIKRLAKMHQDAKEAWAVLQLEHLKKSEQIVDIFAGILESIDLEQPDSEAGRNLKSILETHNVEALKEDCEKLKAFHTDNYLPLLWKFYRSHRSTLFRLVNSLSFLSTSQDQTVIDALVYLLESESRKSEYLPATVDISFASEKWLATVEKMVDGDAMFDRKHFEVFVFSTLAQELKSGDVAIAGSEEFGDYRDGLLDWAECEPLVEEFCREVELPATASEFVQKLKDELSQTADEIDAGYIMNGSLTVDERGKLVLKKIEKQKLSPKALLLESAILERMPERNLLDVLANVQSYTDLVRHFGPLSGSDPKLERPVERYLLNLFTYGCNLGPAQAARHMRGLVTPHMFSFVNRRHVDAKKLDAALVDLLNDYNKFRLPKFWGDGSHASADGTKYDLSEQNLMAEYHIRYGDYGGIAYHHVSDLYIALFSHFISCGTWEAVYIIDGLLKNKSEIQPDTLHADTQGQTTTVFGLSYLLGIKLLPRIRNIKDLVFYRPDKNKRYQHIDSLFTENADWELIETHWQDLMQVVLSIKAGKILPSTLLRKLGNYSRKNRLYLAYRELGRVVRTIFLLKYVSDRTLRERIHAETNKVEAFHNFAKWLNFGGEILQENDPEEQEKLIKYNNLVANALIYQNVIDQTRIIRDLMREGFYVTAEELKVLSPYQTAHIKRFGDYVVDLSEPPPPLDIEYTFTLEGQ